jgi:16S rRNA (guanine1207-N2)-methyltransferase
MGSALMGELISAGQPALYGVVPHSLLDEVPADAIQCSPRVPGAALLTEFAAERASSFIVQAPPATLERRSVLAAALQALLPGAPLVAFAPNKKGGTRIAKELAAFGCSVTTDHRRHHQIAFTHRPEDLAGIAEAIEAGAPRLLPGLGLWTQPGLFSWDRVDPGSALLLAHLPPLAGRGADLGCGYGLLARAVLQFPDCLQVSLIDIDRRALDMASRNVPAERTTAIWADVRTGRGLPAGLDFVVMNPPFHDGGAEDKAIGVAFIAAAARMLRSSGQLWLTANRHLPYEETLRRDFAAVDLIVQERGFKIYKATK